MHSNFGTGRLSSRPVSALLDVLNTCSYERVPQLAGPDAMGVELGGCMHEHGLEHGLENGVNLVDLAVDVLQDAFFDTLYLIPFLLVTYLFMEWIEHKTSSGAQRAIQRAGAAGPAIGAVLGVVPQCGFSAAASTLYAARVVSLGTLFAVFLSTSDEMLPIFIAEQVAPSVLLSVIGMKIVIGMAFGFAVDAVMRATHRDHRHLHIHEICERDHCDCSTGCAACEHNPASVYEHNDCDGSCSHEHAHHDHSHDAGWGAIFKSACKHTAQVTLFVFLVSLALNALLALVGEDALAGFLGSNGLLACCASAVVGLIPNCAASVAIAQLYIEGVIGFGPMMAGLLSAAGVGMLVLFRTNRRLSENAGIVVALVVVSALCGIALDFAGFVV